MTLTAPQQRVVDLLKENEGRYIELFWLADFNWCEFRNPYNNETCLQITVGNLRRLDLLTEFEPNKYRLK